MNFNNEFGYPYWSEDIDFKYHRYRHYERATSICHYKLLLWDFLPTILSDICKKCLSTFSAEEIEDLKHWLILKKLGISV